MHSIKNKVFFMPHNRKHYEYSMVSLKAVPKEQACIKALQKKNVI